MNLPTVLTAWEEYVAGAIGRAVNDPTIPERKTRYHGKLPDDCCTDKGTLGVWWEHLDPSVSFPIPLLLKGEMSGAFQLADFGARYAMCWYVPKAEELTAKETLKRWDGDAHHLALIAEYVTAELLDLSCGQASLGDGVICQGVRWKSTRQDISGGCAGVEWHAVLGLSGAEGPT